MNESLQKEIIKHIFSLFQIDLFNATPVGGLVFDAAKKLSRRVKLEDGADVVEVPVWAAQIDLAPGSIKAIVSDIGEGLPDVVLLIRFNDQAQYGMRLSRDPNDSGSFLTYTMGMQDNRRWIPTSTFLQASVLAGFEALTNLPRAWQPDSETALFEDLLGFIQNGESD